MARDCSIVLVLLLLSSCGGGSSHNGIVMMVVEGDSISSTLGAPNAAGVRLPSWTGQWPLILKSQLFENIELMVVAEGSSRVLAETTTEVNGVQTTAKSMMWRYGNIVKNKSPSLTGQKSAYLILGGVNDIRYDHEEIIEAAQIYEGLRDIWTQARKDGFSVIAFKVLPFSDGQTTVRKQRVWTELNQLISSNSQAYDCLVDFNAEPMLVDSTDGSIFADHIHLTDNGDNLLAKLVKQQCLSALVSD
jgi:hypothetical protein